MTKEMTLPLGGHKKQWDPPKWMYPIIYNKWKIMICLLIAVLLCGLFSFGYAAANSDDELGMGLNGMIDTIFEFDDVTEWITVTSDYNLQEFTNTMKYSPMRDANGRIVTVGGMVSDIYRLFQAMGLALLAIYWSIGFFDMLVQSNNQIIFEQMLKKFVLLIIGIAIVSNSKEIVSAILSIVDSLTLRAKVVSLGSLNDVTDKLVNIILAEERGKGFLAKTFIELGYMVRLLIPYAGAIVANIGVKIFAMARYIEICVIAALSPVMFSDFSNSSGGFTHTNAFRALKTVIALALQGLVIVIGIMMCGMIAGIMVSGNVTTDNFFSITLGLLSVQLARVGIAAKSQQISRQVVGLG